MNVTKFEFYVDVIMYDRLEKGKNIRAKYFQGNCMVCVHQLILLDERSINQLSEAKMNGHCMSYGTSKLQLMQYFVIYFLLFKNYFSNLMLVCLAKLFKTNRVLKNPIYYGTLLYASVTPPP